MPKKSLQIFLLFAFSFLLIPTSYWHHCEADHHIKLENGKQEVHIENGDCFICDFQFQPCESLAFHTTQTLLSPKSYHTTALNEVVKQTVCTQPLRGPPTC